MQIFLVEEFYPVVTVELIAELDRLDMNIADLIEQFLHLIYGHVKTVPFEYVRPLIIFARVHQMPHLMDSLEEMMMAEPPIIPTTLLDHLIWSERYKLENLLRLTLFRIERRFGF